MNSNLETRNNRGNGKTSQTEQKTGALEATQHAPGSPRLVGDLDSQHRGSWSASSPPDTLTPPRPL